MQGVYRIRNKVNDKRYIGSSEDVEGRWNDHQNTLRVGSNSIVLQRAWDKYGEENFVFEIEEEVKGNRKVLLAREQIFLDEGFELGILYNVARKAGGGNLGSEVNNRISQALKGRVSPKKGMKFPQGYPSRRKYYETHDSHLKGTTLTEEHLCRVRRGLAKHYETHDGHFKGKCHSQQTKDEYSRVRRGKVWMCKPYQALYNEITEQFISSGKNFAKICRELGLNHDKLYEVKSGHVKCTRDGWRLATSEEIKTWQ